MRHTLLLAVAVTISGIASAQTPIGPFAGTESDGFETQQSGSFDPCIVGRVFNNNGDLCTPGSSGSHITGGWGFMCTIQEHGGARFTGSAGGAYEYTFDTPVSRFGGYFGTNAGPPGGGTANFYDAANNFLGSAVITAPADCTWTWNGWQDDSGAGFSRIEVPSNVFGGAFLMMDDMEADFGGGGGFGTELCFGDGSGTNCPCTNPSANGGCANSTGDGCTLHAQPAAGGTLDAGNAIPGQPGLFFQGDNTIGGGSGVVFGDGLRCCGQSVVRLGVVLPDGNGDASLSGIQALGGANVGDTKCYQYWYRNPNGSPCLAGFNLSNAVEITW